MPGRVKVSKPERLHFLIKQIKERSSRKIVMPPKTNPLKLNKLQQRTLALAQVLAADHSSSKTNEETGEATLLQLPHAHGSHVHVGPYTVAAKDASGFSNPAVWVVLERKGLARADGLACVVLTKEGQSYDTGLGEKFFTHSDH